MADTIYDKEKNTKQAAEKIRQLMAADFKLDAFNVDITYTDKDEDLGKAKG